MTEQIRFVDKTFTADVAFHVYNKRHNICRFFNSDGYILLSRGGGIEGKGGVSIETSPTDSLEQILIKKN